MPTVQTISPPLIAAVPEPATGVTCVKVVPSTAGMRTTAPEAAFGVKFLTKTRKGYVSPGFTQPTADTNEFSTSSRCGGVLIVAEPAPEPIQRPDVLGVRSRTLTNGVGSS